MLNLHTTHCNSFNDISFCTLKEPRREIIKWILEAWDELLCESIKRSFVSCALATAMDGSQDDEIHCLKEGQPCHTRKAMLVE